MQPYQQFAGVMEQFVRKFATRDRNEKFCYGVTVTQCYTLDMILNHGQMTMQRLSAELGLAISTLTRVVDILVRDGFIKRYQGEQDRRHVYVELTDKGKELAVKLKKCSEQIWRVVFDKIPKSKQSELIENIDLLHDILEEVNKQCCTPTRKQES
jgi:DNA-binding MarR family transcriptional regulator